MQALLEKERGALDALMTNLIVRADEGSAILHDRAAAIERQTNALTGQLTNADAELGRREQALSAAAETVADAAQRLTTVLGQETDNLHQTSAPLPSSAPTSSPCATPNTAKR